MMETMEDDRRLGRYGGFGLFCLLIVGWTIMPEGLRSDGPSEGRVLVEASASAPLVPLAELAIAKGQAVPPVDSGKTAAEVPKTMSCNDTEAAQVAKWLEAHGADKSNCPKDTWLDALRDLDSDPYDKLLINVGVNKGFNFVRWLSLWRPDLGICPKDWMGGEHCGVCSDCEAECSVVAKPRRLTGQKKRPLVLVGVEPVASTIDLIKQAAEATGINKDPTIQTHLVQAGCAEVRTKAYMPDCAAGEENCKLIVFDDIETFSVEDQRKMLSEASYLDIYRVDDLLNLPDIKAAVELRGPGRPIDILHIDTEGHDAGVSGPESGTGVRESYNYAMIAVLRGASRTLADPGIRMLSFEYHRIGGWQRNTLKDSVAYLDGLGYDCYFQGQGRLFRLTGCWHDVLEMHVWSNVVCTRRIDPYREVLETFRAKAVDLL